MNKIKEFLKCRLENYVLVNVALNYINRRRKRRKRYWDRVFFESVKGFCFIICSGLKAI